LVAAGRVTVRGTVASKPATAVETDAAVVVRADDDDPNWASRGAHKLLGALAAFTPAGLAVKGRRCLDAGASTGGFTDVLLREGAAQVVAADVGRGLLDWRLRTDERVLVRDRINVRNLTVDDIDGAVELVVADLSFISLKLVLPALLSCTTEDADLVPMVKPQFEVGKDRLGSGGVVRDPELRASAVLDVIAEATGLGLAVAGVVASPLPGPAGNVEYFLWLRRGAATDPERAAELVDEAVREGPS
jgi:23S rRNA (cytidine1920-2'-O)/16S rRNA (cytidine1409-2'-O)-methyltransferase